jgi:hypothetical protein
MMFVGARFTDAGLVAFVIKALLEKWGYVYGTTGQIFTPAILERKLIQYPNQIKKHLDFIKANYLKKDEDGNYCVITTDCVNLIKAYIWQNDDKPGDYDPDTDLYSADAMFEAATVKGTIDTMPDVPGLAVRLPGHIGVYIGDGKVIEARGTRYGVVQTELDERPWTHWLEVPGITYLKGAKECMCKGNKGEDVVVLQGMLNLCGASLTVDGSFGRKTQDAVKEFQTKNGLESDGVVDFVTSRVLTQKVLEKVRDYESQVKQLNDRFTKINQAYIALGELIK